MKHTLQRYVGRDPNLEFLTDSEIAMLEILIEEHIKKSQEELTRITNKDLIYLTEFDVKAHSELLKKLHRM
jgi:hypothetical protein